MEKSVKRAYMLVEYMVPQFRVIETEEEYNAILKGIEKYNKEHKGKDFFANVTREKMDNGLTLVIIQHYNMLLKDKMTITEMDDLTSKYTPSELVEHFNGRTRTSIPDIQVAYLMDKPKKEKSKDKELYTEDKLDKLLDKRVKYAGVLYRDDDVDLNKKYIRSVFEYWASQNSYSFFMEFANAFRCNHNISGNADNLLKYANEVKYGIDSSENMLRAALDMVDILALKYDKNGNIIYDKDGKAVQNRRGLRDVYFFVKTYNCLPKGRISPFKNNKLNSKQRASFDEFVQKQIAAALAKCDSDYLRNEREEDSRLEEAMLDKWDQESESYRR